MSIVEGTKKNIIVEEANKNGFGARIRIIGVGGGGGNMIDHLVREKKLEREGMDSIMLIAANTDCQAMARSLAKEKINIGTDETRGLGAGMKPEIGKKAAEESSKEIKNILDNSDIVFIASGLGGGTGTGAAPVVAKISKECQALTIAVVTTPFDFEGKKRKKLAMEGLENLKKECDSVIVISNSKLKGAIKEKMGIKESFKMVDEILAKAITGMSSIVLNSGQSDINLDFADVQTAMSHRGLAIMGIGSASGSNSAQKAIDEALASPLLDDMEIDGAKGILVHFRMHPSCPLDDIDEAMSSVNMAVDEDADVFFGTTTDESMDENTVEVTIVATGLKEKDLPRQQPINEVNQNIDNISVFSRKVSGGYNISDDVIDQPAINRLRQD